MNLQRTLVLLVAGLAALAWTPAMAGDAPTNSAAADSTAPAAPPMPATTPAAPQPAATTPEAPPAARPLVAIVVTPELKAAKWNREWGEIITGGKSVDDIADAITGQTQTMLTAMGFNSKIVAPSDKLDGARFYLTPNVKQSQETTAVFAFSKVSDTMVVEWRVTDPGGGTLLLNSVVGTGTSAAGNMFTAHDEAKTRFQRLMEDLFGKSKTLLAPVLTHP